MRRVNDRKRVNFSFISLLSSRFPQRRDLCSSREHSRKRINAVGTGPFIEAGFMSRRRYTGAGIYPCTDCTRCLHTFDSSPASKANVHTSIRGSVPREEHSREKKRRSRPKRSEGRNLKLGGLSPCTVLLIRLLTKSNYPVRLTVGVCGAEGLRLRRDSSTPINYRCVVREVSSSFVKCSRQISLTKYSLLKI